MKYIVFIIMLMTSITMNAQTDVPVFLQKNGYAKSMAKIFSCLEEEKLYQANKEQEEIREKFAKDKDIDKNEVFSVETYLYPIWHVANSLFLNLKSGKDEQKDLPLVQFDPWKAYHTLQQATHDVADKNNVDAFFSQRKLNYTVASIKADIENNLIEETVNKGSEEAFDKLIATLYDYADMRMLEEKREQIAFVEAFKSDKVAGAQKYLDKYKSFNASHLKVMEHRRDSLAFEQLGKDANDCKLYLKSYPNSEYNNQVTKLLHRYEFENMAHTVSACKQYLAVYAESEYADQVKQIMAQAAYNDARQASTPEALGDFLQEYDWSEFCESAKKGLNEILQHKFLSRYSSLSELENFVSNRRFSQYVDYTPYVTFYTNLTNMPTSAAMMECKDLTGEVRFSTNDYEEVYQFDDLGLLINHRHSRSGTNDSWDYDFNEKGEVRPVSKTDNKGKTTTYKTTFNANGLLSSITGSDGTQTTFVYTADNKLKTVTNSKNGKKTQIDTYDSEGHIDHSERSGVVLAYEYNYQGDVIRMNKKRGNIVMDQTSYEYEYDSSGKYWCTMRQYNNGSFFLAKSRTFKQPSSNNYQSYRHSVGANYNDNDSPVDTLSEDDVVSDQQIFDVVEHQPSFPGGQKALMQWLSENVQYPQLAYDNGIQGRVIVQYVVEKDGSISEVTVSKSIDPSLDKEALRVVKSMPSWRPGMQNGKPVRVKYTMPVTFKLQ